MSHRESNGSCWPLGAKMEGCSVFGIPETPEGHPCERICPNDSVRINPPRDVMLCFLVKLPPTISGIQLPDCVSP